MTKASIARFESSIEKAEAWIMERFNAEGGFDAEQDLGAYYKAPYWLYISGHSYLAQKSLAYIVEKFSQAKGDFRSSANEKTAEPFLNEFPNYIDGWLAISAQKMGRFDIAYPVFKHLRNFYHPELGAFTTHRPYGEGVGNVDVFTTAHLGHVALYFGDLNKAKRAGNFLQCSLSVQPDPQACYYLRMNSEGKAISSFAQEAADDYVITLNQPEQRFFILGYIIGFLTKLYEATKDEAYLRCARNHLEYLQRCHDDLFISRLSNQVAWGTAVLAHTSGEERYAEIALKIAENLTELQNAEGAWASEAPSYLTFDATIENALWLREIVAELSMFLAR